jgi:hypothetical protein
MDEECQNNLDQIYKCNDEQYVSREHLQRYRELQY